MKIIEVASQTLNGLKDTLDGKNLGMTCGFKILDNSVSKIKHGQIWTIGGSTGTGKSYFVLNMIDGMLKEKADLKIAVFSTELSGENYFLRYAAMRAGLYNLQIQTDIENCFEKMVKSVEQIIDEREGHENSLDIYGDIYSYEDISQILDKTNYDIVFIDYIQDLTVKNDKKVLYDTKDTMPIISKEIKKMALNRKSAFIVISQINNSAFSQEAKKSGVQPFTFGKELVQASTVALYLQRPKDKRTGRYDKNLIVTITKAREGNLGQIALNIQPGYKLQEMLEWQSNDYIESIKKQL